MDKNKISLNNCEPNLSLTTSIKDLLLGYLSQPSGGGLTAVVMAMVAAQKYESPLLYLRLDMSLAGKHQALKGNSSLLCRFQVRKESTYEKNTL